MNGLTCGGSRQPAPGRLAALTILSLFLAGLAGAGARGEEPAAESLRPRRARRPAAVSYARDGQHLLVANRRTGSISVVETRSSRIMAEHNVGQGLADLQALPDGHHWLVVDQAGDALLLLTHREGAIRVVARQAVAPDPVSLALAPGGKSCVVASRWSRCLTFVSLDGDRNSAGPPTLEIQGSLVVPFSPQALAMVRGGSTLVAADAFGGEVAVVDPAGRTLERVVRLNAHNIRGLAATPDGQAVVLGHQVLNSPARTVSEDVQWGILLTNNLRLLSLDRLLETAPAADPQAGSRLINLGAVSRGAGDPAALAYDRDGNLILALAGVDQVAIGPAPGPLARRIAVGRRPMALAVSPDGRTVAVAESLDDSVGFVDLPTGQVWSRTVLGPAPEPALADRGERLFFDARLSRGGWMSCHSCHTDGHSNGLNVDTFGDGELGAPKRVPSLLGAGTSGPWGWDGRFAQLEEQVHQSSVTTMQGVWPTDEEVAELSAYLRSLAPPRPPTVAASEGAAVERGRGLFARECTGCHAPPDYTTPRRYDVGLTDETGHRQFNPPSLRGVGVRSPLLHDGRARTLEDVLRGAKHPRDAEWTTPEIEDLIAFLKTL